MKYLPLSVYILLSLLVLQITAIKADFASFDARQISMAEHPSGDLVIWRLTENSVAELGIIPLQDGKHNFNAYKWLDSINAIGTVCDLSVSNGGVIYIAYVSKDHHFKIAGYTLDGKLRWQDSFSELIPPDSQCAISTGVADRIVAAGDQFIYFKPPGSSNGKLTLYPKPLPSFSNRQQISRTGGTAQMNVTHQGELSYCRYEPEYFGTLCTTVQGAQPQLPHYHPAVYGGTFWPDSGIDTKGSSQLIYNNDSIQYFHMTITGGAASVSRQRTFHYPGHIESPKTILSGNTDFMYSENDFTIASTLFTTRSQPVSANVIHWTGYEVKNASSFTLPPDLELPEEYLPATVIDDSTPCNTSQTYQPVNMFYTTTDGQAVNLYLNKTGHIEPRNTTLLPDMTGLDIKKAVSLVSSSMLVVLAGDNSHWRLTEIPLESFDLTLIKPSSQGSFGSNDLSAGMEVLLDGLIDVDNPERWAMVLQSSYGQWISLFNDKSPSGQCGLVVNGSNKFDPDAIGMLPAPGSTSIGALTNDLAKCLLLDEHLFYNNDLFLMVFRQGEWQFTGKHLRLAANFQSNGVDAELFWQPENCSAVIYSQSSPKVGFCWDDPIRRDTPLHCNDLFTFGYHRAVFRASELEDASEIPSIGEPHNNDNKAIIATTVTGTGLTVAALIFIAYKYVSGRYRSNYKPLK